MPSNFAKHSTVRVYLFLGAMTTACALLFLVSPITAVGQDLSSERVVHLQKATAELRAIYRSLLLQQDPQIIGASASSSGRVEFKPWMFVDRYLITGSFDSARVGVIISVEREHIDSADQQFSEIMGLRRYTRLGRLCVAEVTTQELEKIDLLPFVRNIEPITQERLAIGTANLSGGAPEKNTNPEKKSKQ